MSDFKDFWIDDYDFYLEENCDMNQRYKQKNWEY